MKTSQVPVDSGHVTFVVLLLLPSLLSGVIALIAFVFSMLNASLSEYLLCTGCELM